MILRILLPILLLLVSMNGWVCYTGCPSKPFPTEKGLKRHQNTCTFARKGFANALATSKRKLAAEREEVVAKALANEQAEIERRRLREMEAEASFLPEDSNGHGSTQVSLE